MIRQYFFSTRCRAAGLLCLLGAAAIGPAAPLHAQAESGLDTRLRLDQQLDRQRADKESETLEGAEPLDGAPASMTIDGETYAVGNNVTDMGQALYIAVQRKQWTDARRFLDAYQKLAGYDPMLRLYARGALAREKGDLAAAERDYRELLAIRPDFLPGQLELARALFENRKDREAERAFDTVRARLAADGPKAEGVGRTVEAFLAVLKRRRSWQGSLAIGPRYSSNLNQSSASYTCLLATDDGSCLIDRKVPDPIRSTGIGVEATLNSRLPLRGHSGLRARAILFGDYYPGHHAFSQATLIARLGYDYQTARDSFSVSPSVDLSTLGSSLLYRAWGLNAEWSRSLSDKAMIKLEGNRRRFDYRLPAYQAQDGDLTDLFLTGWYLMRGDWTLFGGPDFLEKTADDPVNAYRQWGVRLGVNKSFGNSVGVLLMASARERKHRAYSELFEAQRRDRELGFTAIARFPALAFAGLVPEAVVQHNRVKSNIDWLYSHKRTAISLRLEYAF